MKNMSQPVVFFGTDSFSVATLTALLAAGYPVAAVITKPDSKSGRGHTLTPPLIKILANQHSIPVWQPEKLRDITPLIQTLDSPIGILASYGKIIPPSTIALFRPGIINIHPSLLPLYRGPSPIETTITNGDSKTGVSIMQLSAGMDNGPIYTAKEYVLTNRETSPELYKILSEIGAQLLVEVLPRIQDGSLLPIAQNDKEATYTSLLSKEDAWLKPNMVTAHEAERLVRARLTFPKTKISIQEHTLIITKSHVVEKNSSALTIACKNTTFLAIDQLIAPSGREMSAADFERGYLRRT